MSSEKTKPVFVKVETLAPATKGHNLVVKVLDNKPISGGSVGRGGASGRMSECLVGDETGVIIFTTRNEQVDVTQPGKYLTLRNARIDMFRGSMRLAVDQWGKIEETTADFQPKEDNNLSMVEFEMVPVPHT
eukprot:g662.t1